tara:strand:- start:149 stop:439 length:291 start_codon:yes stop_codon:yes gene_type:complete
MAYGLYQLTSSATLIEKGSNKGIINSITISNGNASNEVTIGLYYNEGTTKTYVIENCYIPVGASLILDKDLSFDNRILDLKIDISGTSPDVSVIIK